MLGAAQADALGPVLAGDPGIGAGVGVGPHPKAPDLVGPAEQPFERRRGLGCLDGHRAEDDLAGGAVDGDHVAGHHLDVADVEAGAVAVDDHGLGPADGGGADAARDHGGVGDEPAAAGQDRLRGDQAVQVLRGGLGSHQHDVLAGGGACLGLVGGEHDASDRRTGRGAEAGGQDLVGRVGGEARVQEPFHLLAGEAADGGGVVDQVLVGHLHGHAQRGSRGALPDTGLQQVQAAVLDGELEVAHVLVALLEAGHDVDQLVVLLGEGRREVGQRQRVAESPPRRPRPGR